MPDLPPATAANARLFSAQSTKSGATNYGGVTVTRDGQRHRVTANAALQPGDIITTDGETVLALEFGIGGRVSVGRNASVRIVGDRQIESLAGTTVVRSHLDHPLEIQTNGGILGIRD